jgi:uncharacterized membrane protein (DUF106 family)
MVTEKMANEIIFLQIMFIALGMVAFGLILNKIMGISSQSSKEFRERSKNLQERMKNAQLIQDVNELRRIQQESMQLTKDMFKTQLLPSCIRCIIFLGIFAIVGVFYAPYNAGLLPFPILFFGSGWVAVYFLFSITFSLIYYGASKLYKKFTKKDIKNEEDSIGMMEMISTSSVESRDIFKSNSFTDEKKKVKDSWKDKIQN